MFMMLFSIFFKDPTKGELMENDQDALEVRFDHNSYLYLLIQS